MKSNIELNMDNGALSKGDMSRKRILTEAFRLFATMPYERVSFSLMEKEIGISRGSMVYYFKNKDGLFREVLKVFVFEMASARTIPDAYKLSLCSFYNYFIETLIRNKERLAQIGVTNVNEALLRIENSALAYVENFRELAIRWYDEELKIWQGVVENAISIGELKQDIDTTTIGHIFENCYLGYAFKGAFSMNGYDLDALKKFFDQFYSLLRR